MYESLASCVSVIYIFGFCNFIVGFVWLRFSLLSIVITRFLTIGIDACASVPKDQIFHFTVF